MGKKIAYFFYSLTPALACIVLQLGIGMVLGMIAGIIALIGVDPTDATAVQQTVMDAIAASAAPGVFAYHIVGIIVFGLWYYFGCGRPKAASPKIFANVKFWGSAVLGALVFVSINYVVIYFLSVCMPKVVEAYGESWALIELSSPLLLYISTIFLAPIGEEFMLRGLTLHIAQKCTKHFWIANIIQALVFGVIHLNLVQGIYAFLGGLLLGWLYKKYNSLYIVILVHFLVNLSACTWVDPVFSLIPDDIKWWLLLTAGLVAVLIGLLAWNDAFKKKDKVGEAVIVE